MGSSNKKNARTKAKAAEKRKNEHKQAQKSGISPPKRGKGR